MLSCRPVRPEINRGSLGFEPLLYMRTSNSQSPQSFASPFHVGTVLVSFVGLVLPQEKFHRLFQLQLQPWPVHMSIPPSNRHPVVAVVLLLLESTRQFPAALPEEGSVCLKSPDQGFFAFQSPQQLIEASLHKDPLAHQFPLKFEQTHRQ